MLKKSLLLFLLLGTFAAAKAENLVFKPLPCSSFACVFTQTNFSLSLTGNSETSYTLTKLNFAAHYTTNPYSQGQWELGVVIGQIPCASTSYVYGRKLQFDGRVMEGGITTSGYVVVKWVSGPPMPSNSTGGQYLIELGNVNISATGG